VTTDPGGLVELVIGDALECLRELPADSVDCCVTSPPYWGLRDYKIPPSVWGGDPDCRHRWGGEGKSGQRLRNGEGSNTAKQAVAITLHPSTGAFCDCGAWRGALGLEPDYRLYVGHLVAVLREVWRVLRPDGTLWLNLGDCYANNGCGGGSVFDSRVPAGLKAKDLVGIPWRVAFALQDDGWWLRRDIIWAKPNPMPESVRDRPTTAHEYLFLLTRSARYYYDSAAIKEPSGPKNFRGNHQPYCRPSAERSGSGGKTVGNNKSAFRAATQQRNKRSVWTVTPAPFAGAHFATFPPALIEPSILAGCRPGGMVLDPFAGAGTTALVARRLGRDFIGVELNPAYAEMARQRLAAA